LDITLRGKNESMAFIDLGDQFVTLQKVGPSASGR